MPGTGENEGASAGRPAEWRPIPDPTTLTTEAVQRATDVFRREITALHDLHDKDLAAFREVINARLAGMDQDRARLWDRAEDLIKRFTSALADFRVEVERRDASNRQLIEQRLADLDKAIKLAADGLAAVPDTTEIERAQAGNPDHTARMTAEREYMTGPAGDHRHPDDGEVFRGG